MIKYKGSFNFSFLKGALNFFVESHSHIHVPAPSSSRKIQKSQIPKPRSLKPNNVLPKVEPLSPLPNLSPPLPPCHSQPHQNRRRFGNGEPLLRPHARVDEAPQPRHQRRHRLRVQPALRHRPQLQTLFLQRPGPLRGPGPGPLLPGHPRTDFWLQRHLRQPSAHERLRAAGLLHGQHLAHVPERHERLPPRPPSGLQNARFGVRCFR